MMAEGTLLREQVATLNETIQELQSDNNAYQERANTLQNDLRHERENLVALRNAVANAQPTPPLASFPVPDPERYDGNREKLPLFKSHLLMKLQGDDARFPTEQHKLGYTVGLLQGNAFAQIQPYILETTINFTNVTALLNDLEAAFSDPDRTGTAERKQESLKQTKTVTSPLTTLSSHTMWPTPNGTMPQRKRLSLEVSAPRSKMPLPSPTKSQKPMGNSPPTFNSLTIAFVHEKQKKKGVQPPVHLPRGTHRPRPVHGLRHPPRSHGP